MKKKCKNIPSLIYSIINQGKIPNLKKNTLIKREIKKTDGINKLSRTILRISKIFEYLLRSSIMNFCSFLFRSTS